MNIAILYNGHSDKVTDRTELVQQIREYGHNAFIFGIRWESLNDYYKTGKVTFVPILANRNNTNPITEIKSIFSVKKQIKLNHIDAAIIYGVKNHAAMAIGAKLGSTKKILCVVNGSGNLFRISGYKGALLRFMSFPVLRIAYAFSTGICFQNADDKQLFISRRLVKDNEKVFLTGGSGVNLTKFPKQKLPEGNFFLFLARITPSKGITEYIKAAETVKKKYPHAVFDIVGPLDTAVENTGDGLLKQACDKGTVVYHGATNDVPGWMGKCRYFVYPSYYPEGVPRCAMQAIATGRPIVTCDTSGCRETVKDGINGFMIPPRNSAILAEKMVWMIEHPSEVQQMAEESRKFAEEKFNVDRINQILVNRII